VVLEFVKTNYLAKSTNLLNMFVVVIPIKVSRLTTPLPGSQWFFNLLSNQANPLLLELVFYLIV